MPVTPIPGKPSKHTSRHFPLPTSAMATRNIKPDIAGKAIVDGLSYLKKRLEWSGSKIARVLHLPANTINTWLKNGNVPLHSAILTPDVQAVIHLLAIHRSLEAMFDMPAHQQAWLTTRHPTLAATPEDIMSKSIDGLIFIRQYLDYVRGRGA